MMIVQPTSQLGAAAAAPDTGRVMANLQVLYGFREGAGDIVHDISGVGSPVDLKIMDPLDQKITWLEDGLRVNQPSVLVADGPVSELVEALQATQAITIEAWVKRVDFNPSDLARIITFSAPDDPDNRNFSLREFLQGYQVFLRTTTGANGDNQVVETSENGARVLKHVVFTRTASGAATLYINGVVVSQAVIGGNFSNWDSTFQLTLAGVSANLAQFAWLGEFHLVAIYSQALTETEVGQNFDSGVQTNLPPTVDAGPDQIIGLPGQNDQPCAETKLQGRVIDPGLVDPQQAQLSVTWEKDQAQSSPGAVTFSDAHNVETPVCFIEPGTYVLRLNVSNGLLTGADEVKIIVNQAPVVDAGPDQIVNLPDPAKLSGTLEDETAPPGLMSQITWTQVSGPGTVTFSNRHDLETVADFSDNGVYVLRLTASDGQLEASDEVTITVNKAPVVEAGPNQNINLPGPAQLSGEVIDDGLGDPNQGTIMVRWSKVSGPGMVTFADETALQTKVSFAEGGSYILQLEASNGLLTGSDALTITTNQPPTVNAGPNQVLTVPGSTELAGTVSDDGLPDPPGAVTTLWTQVSGPEPAVFGNANDPTTIVTFSLPGQYVLRLTANDGAASAFDEVVIAVAPEPRVTDNLQVLYTFDEGDGVRVRDVSGIGSALDLTIDNRAAVAWVWSSLAINSPTIITTTGSATKLIDSVKQTNEITVELWLRSSLASKPGLARIITCSSGLDTRNFTVGQSGKNYHVRLRTSETNRNASNKDLCGGLVSTTEPAHIVLTRSADEVVRLYVDGVEVADRLVSGDFSNWTEDCSLALANELNGGDIQAWLGKLHLVAVYNRALTGAEIRQNFNYGADTNLAPVVDAGADQVITRPDQAFLAGTIIDDRLTIDQITLTWRKLAGPGGVTFANPSALNTTAAFSKNGRYTLQLTASDGDLSASDEVTIIVHQAPEVEAGLDQIINLPASANLVGTILNDGLGEPQPDPLTLMWSKVDGPGEVTFAEAQALSTTADFSENGTYTLKLTAGNGFAEGSDTVKVIVNSVPIIDAGPDQVISWREPAQLAGAILNDGLGDPELGQITVTWSLVEGPGQATFDDAHALETTVSFSENGVYLLQLTVHNGFFEVSDRLTIVANRVPKVDAGPDQTIALAGLVKLDGVVSDDGFPDPPGTITVVWTKVSGPGKVTFADAEATYTTATFSTGGIYVLRLTASDGAASASAEVTISVTEAPRVTEGLSVLYTFEEGQGHTVHDVSGVGTPLDLAIADKAPVTWVAGGLSIDASTLIASPGPGTKLIEAAKASNQLTIEAWARPANTSQDGPARIVTLSIDTKLRNFTLGQDRDSYVTRLRTTKTNLNGSNKALTAGEVRTQDLSHLVSTFDEGKVRFYLDGAEVEQRQIDGDFSNWDDHCRFGLANEFTGDRTWLGELHLVAVYNRALSPAEVERNCAAGPDTNQPPQVEAGPNQFIRVSEQAELAGTIVDDRPAGVPGTLTVRWSQVEGPGVVTFVDATVPHTTASFDQPGTYVLRLTAHDGQLSASDEVTILVLAETQAVPRVTGDLVVLYTFTQDAGPTVKDVSSVGQALDLTIRNADAATRLPGTLVINDSNIVASAAPATKVTNAVKASNEITIETWVKPAENEVGSSPDRIVTLSVNPSHRNFTLGQFETRYDVRLRTTQTSTNGLPSLSTPVGSLSTQLTHVVYTRSASGQARIYLDGVEQARSLIEGDLSNWDATYQLALANELTLNRTWLGELHLVAVYSRALSFDEVQQNFQAGANSA